MKKLFTIFAAILLAATGWAQSPEKMSYQAVIRNSSNVLVTNTQVGMQISILQGSASGTVVYTETQMPTTNANGLVSIEIGGGPGFNTIDWSNDIYFIKTETDPTGGTSYTITGTSQLLSVPYALHAKTAESVTGTITETDPTFTGSQAANITATDITNLSNLSGTNTGDQDGSETKVTAGTNVTVTGSGTISSPYVVNATVGTSNDFYLGQDTLGGIVFEIYLDQNGEQHGLIVSKTENVAQWQTATSLVGADRTEDGAFNTSLMTSSPAATYVAGLGAGWYLPSVDELSILWHNRYYVQKALRAGSFTLLSSHVYYWSSTEYDATGAFNGAFDYGYVSNASKPTVCSVRAIRAF
jgi:hypothetical protein